MTGAEAVAHIAVPPSIDSDSSREFVAAVEQTMADPVKRVIVLSGGDGVFCKGLNIARIDKLDTSVATFAEVLLSLRRASMAVISVVDGVVFGGGVGLVAASDFAIASENSSFGLPEALFGIGPSTVLPFLLERMRPQELRLWALTAYSRSAAEAAQAGLIDLVVPAGDLEKQTAHWVRRLSRTHADGVACVKRVTAEAAGMNLEIAVRKGVELTSHLLNDPVIVQRFRDTASDWI